MKRLAGNRTHFLAVLFTALLFLHSFLFPVRAQDVEVDVELVLAVDVSRSMNMEELDIQRRGYAAALTDPGVLGAIQGGLLGKIAVTYLEWAGATDHRVIVPWRVISSASEANEFSGILLASPLSQMRRTSISGALVESADMFEGNGFTGLRRVIDVSGDGPNNNGLAVHTTRDLIVESGITINGLPLMTNLGGFGTFRLKDLDVYYYECVIGGPGAFVIPVKEWKDFPEAVRRKLILELSMRENTRPDKLPFIQVAAEPKYDCLIGEKLWQQRRNMFNDP